MRILSHSSAWLAAAVLAVVSAGAVSAATPPGSLYGAPGKPDISGLWNVVGSRSSNWTPEPPPYAPKYKEQFERRIAANKAGQPLADPGSRCLPHGLPTALMFGGYPIEIIQTPGRVTVIKENFSQTWRVWTDGRQHPADPELGFLGHSIGKWEGDTLVVDIVGLRDDTLLDTERTMPHSTKLHIVQRWRKLDPATLELKMTADDSEAFPGAKLESTTIMKQSNDDEMLELFCEAPGFDINPDGTFSTVPSIAK